MKKKPLTKKQKDARERMSRADELMKKRNALRKTAEYKLDLYLDNQSGYCDQYGRFPMGRVEGNGEGW